MFFLVITRLVSGSKMFMYVQKKIKLFFNYLESIKLIPPISVIIDELSITLFPNIAKFERELCALYANDTSNWNKVSVDSSLVNIRERRLKVKKPQQKVRKRLSARPIIFQDLRP